MGIECSALVISQYRFLWLNLSELLQSLGNACKWMHFNGFFSAEFCLLRNLIEQQSHHSDHKINSCNLVVVALFIYVFFFHFFQMLAHIPRTACSCQFHTLSMADLRVDWSEQKTKKNFLFQVRQHHDCNLWCRFGNSRPWTRIHIQRVGTFSRCIVLFRIVVCVLRLLT